MTLVIWIERISRSQDFLNQKTLNQIFRNSFHNIVYTGNRLLDDH